MDELSFWFIRIVRDNQTGNMQLSYDSSDYKVSLDTKHQVINFDKIIIPEKYVKKVSK